MCTVARRVCIAKLDRGGDRRAQLVDELIGEERGPHRERHRVDALERVDGRPGRGMVVPVAAAVDDLERHAHRRPPVHGEALLGHDALEAAPGEEAHVAAVEDAAPVVVEPAHGHAHPRVPVREVRDARDDRPSGPEAALGLGEEALGVAHVLEHVGGHDDVIVATDFGGDAAAEVGGDEPVDPRPHPVVLDEVDAGDVVADLPQLLAQDTVRAAQVEDAAGGTIAEPGEYAPGCALSAVEASI